MTQVLGYSRVSTDEQGRSGLGLEAQRSAIEAEAERRGWTVEWVTDEASGKSLDRPGIQRALEHLENGGPKVLVAAKLDRIARSALDFLGLVERAKSHGWSLIVLDIDLDMTTAVGMFTATIMAASAELERNLIAERTREALAAAKRRGVRLGGPVGTPEDLRQRIYREREAGDTLQAIADRLNEEGVPTTSGGEQWWPSTVRSVVESVNLDHEAERRRDEWEGGQ